MTASDKRPVVSALPDTPGASLSSLGMDTASDMTDDSSSAPAGRASRAPLDPRLLRHVKAARWHVVRTAFLGTIQAAAIIATALALAGIGSNLLVENQLPLSNPTLLVIVAVALLIRALAVMVEQRTAHRAATDTIAQLRQDLISHAATLGPRAGAGRGADLTSLATTGLEHLRPYLVGYVPKLLLTATVTPLLLVTVGFLDIDSMLIAIVTLPLIPLFMILVGKMTVGRSEKLLEDMRSLWAQMLDLVDGLPTLTALGREKGPERIIAALGDRHRASTMGSLRYAFLSSFVLELLATLSVALIAVHTGLRLVFGEIALYPALALLVLAPEIYLPLRQVGQQYHSSTDGLAAVNATFEILEEQPLGDGTQPAPDLSHTTIRLEQVSVASREGYAPRNCSGEIVPGSITALVGPSGSGKTTLQHIIMATLAPTSGRAVLLPDDGSAPLPVLQVKRDSYWKQIMWLPQRPVLRPGSLREILTDGALDITDEQIYEAARRTGLDTVISQRGLDLVVGRSGHGLSLGERQRVSLTRALLADAPLVILDEPTAHLDGSTEQLVIDLIRHMSDQGRTVIMTAHRETLIDIATHTVEVAS